MKKASIFKTILSKVSNLSWGKGNTPTKNKNMKPGKGFNQPVSDHDFDYLKELDDSEFDKLIIMLFKQRGYTVAEKENGDDSVDVILQMNGESTFVQYKHWREHEVSLEVLESFDAVMDAESVRHGIIITTGLFTEDALEYSHSKHLLLINGVDLSQMIETLSNSEEEIQVEPAKDEMPELEPLCPICSREMIKRTARKGKNAGNTFWGCSQFPNCRGVVSG